MNPTTLPGSVKSHRPLVQCARCPKREVPEAATYFGSRAWCRACTTKRRK